MERIVDSTTKPCLCLSCPVHLSCNKVSLTRYLSGADMGVPQLLSLISVSFSCSSCSRQSSGFCSLDPHFRNHNPDGKSSQSVSNTPVSSLPTTLPVILCSRHCKHIRSTYSIFTDFADWLEQLSFPLVNPPPFLPAPLPQHESHCFVTITSTPDSRIPKAGTTFYLTLSQQLNFHLT